MPFQPHPGMTQKLCSNIALADHKIGYLTCSEVSKRRFDRRYHAAFIIKLMNAFVRRQPLDNLIKHKIGSPGLSKNGVDRADKSIPACLIPNKKQCSMNNIIRLYCVNSSSIISSRAILIDGRKQIPCITNPCPVFLQGHYVMVMDTR